MTGTARARHARTEYGPSVDMRVDTPRTDLNDPGVGLRDNGRRVLTYADLRSEEHTSELQSLMRISYAVFCLKKKNKIIINLQIALIYSSLQKWMYYEKQ